MIVSLLKVFYLSLLKVVKNTFKLKALIEYLNVYKNNYIKYIKKLSSEVQL